METEFKLFLGLIIGIVITSALICICNNFYNKKHVNDKKDYKIETLFDYDGVWMYRYFDPKLNRSVVFWKVIKEE